eukprot:89203_1
MFEKLNKNIFNKIINNYSLKISVSNVSANSKQGFDEAVAKSYEIFEEYSKKNDQKIIDNIRRLAECNPNIISIGFEQTLICIFQLNMLEKLIYSNTQKYKFCVEYCNKNTGKIGYKFVENECDIICINNRINVCDTKRFLRMLCQKRNIKFEVINKKDSFFDECVGVLYYPMDLYEYKENINNELKDNKYEENEYKYKDKYNDNIWRKQDDIALTKAVKYVKTLKSKYQSWDKVSEMVNGKTAKQCEQRYKLNKKSKKAAKSKDAKPKAKSKD